MTAGSWAELLSIAVSRGNITASLEPWWSVLKAWPPLCTGVVSAVDVVVRAHFYKYFHPKEALVSNGVLNRCLVLTMLLLTNN